jgi:hypothetical protein
MNKITIFLLLILTMVLTDNSNAHAKKFNKDGYEIEILWKQKGTKKIVAWGKISEGKKECVQMNYTIYFRNSELGTQAKIEGNINNYRPNGRNTFKAEVAIYKDYRNKSIKKSSKNAWYVKSYYLDCLN